MAEGGGPWSAIPGSNHESSSGPIRYRRQLAAYDPPILVMRVATDADSAKGVFEFLSQGQPGRAMNNPSREEFKAGLDLVEARTDLKFEKLNSKLDLIVAGQNHLVSDVRELKRAVSTNKTVYIALILGSALTIVGVVLGVLAFGGQIMEIASGIFQAGQQMPPK